MQNSLMNGMSAAAVAGMAYAYSKIKEMETKLEKQSIEIAVLRDYLLHRDNMAEIGGIGYSGNTSLPNGFVIPSNAVSRTMLRKDGTLLRAPSKSSNMFDVTQTPNTVCSTTIQSNYYHHHQDVDTDNSLLPKYDYTKESIFQNSFENVFPNDITTTTKPNKEVSISDKFKMNGDRNPFIQFDEMTTTACHQTQDKKLSPPPPSLQSSSSSSPKPVSFVRDKSIQQKQKAKKTKSISKKNRIAKKKFEKIVFTDANGKIVDFNDFTKNSA